MGRPLDEDIIIKILERWQKAFKENSHYVSASDLSLVIKDVRELPTIQSVATDTNVGDTISRQAAIDAMAELQGRASSKGELTGISKAWKRIKKLPPIQPEPHEGHWIPHESPDGGEQYECSRCGVLWEFNDGTPEDNEAFYCPKCGARMKGERQK